MQDISWKFFTQTGNIETYLLIKELEAEKGSNNLEGEEEVNGTSTPSGQEFQFIHRNE